MESITKMEEFLKKCTLCPRNCKVNRMADKAGYCGQSASIYVARAALHMWEEPCISGGRGSGTVFFSGCNLRCVFCQNHEIAAGRAGKEIDIEYLAKIFLQLQKEGAANLNLVTGTHYVPQIIRSFGIAKEKGFRIPVLYNSSGYESVETLKLLEGAVDIYLPDFKYINSVTAKKYSNASDYPQITKMAIKEMVRQCKEAMFDDEGYMQRGVIVRHLILPGHVEESKQILAYLYGTYGNDIYYSIMNQYTPLKHVEAYPEINRKITEAEYDEVVDFAIDLGIENGFIQEGETADESFIPQFDCEGI